MIASVGANVVRTMSRNLSTSVVRSHGAEKIVGRGQWPKPGSNLPFSITNRYRLTLYYMLFTGSAFGLPFYFWTQKQ
ncbi:hypothetical protein ONE63_004613 [Megalurothrips usitatus]|uniref:Cytochrome c oxidase polypeptide VIIc n=1 Tax=Megalurothrips usitatus TaxID=439358 RepID=A0AAV7X5N9_9NEOP|nr:hypothetical protein ONE63_004613 [Megalurothrips usitatus]